MEALRFKLLRTTSMDQEIVGNRGNDNSILESIHAALHRLDPHLCTSRDNEIKRKEAEQAASINISSKTPSDESNSDENQPDVIQDEQESLSDNELLL